MFVLQQYIIYSTTEISSVMSAILKHHQHVKLFTGLVKSLNLLNQLQPNSQGYDKVY